MIIEMKPLIQIIFYQYFWLFTSKSRNF